MSPSRPITSSNDVEEINDGAGIILLPRIKIAQVKTIKEVIKLFGLNYIIARLASNTMEREITD